MSATPTCCPTCPRLCTSLLRRCREGAESWCTVQQASHAAPRWAAGLHATAGCMPASHSPLQRRGCTSQEAQFAATSGCHAGGLWAEELHHDSCPSHDSLQTSGLHALLKLLPTDSLSQRMPALPVRPGPSAVVQHAGLARKVRCLYVQVMTAYLMSSEQLGPEAALFSLLKSAPWVHPNDGFLRQVGPHTCGTAR